MNQVFQRIRLILDLCINGGYIHSLSENQAALQKDIEVLKAKQDDVQRRSYMASQKALSSPECPEMRKLLLDSQRVDKTSSLPSKDHEDNA